MKSVSSARRSYITGVAVYIAVVLLSATAIWLLSTDARRKIDSLAVADKPMVKIDIAGDFYSGRVSLQPVYDPAGAIMRQ